MCSAERAHSLAPTHYCHVNRLSVRRSKAAQVLRAHAVGMGALLRVAIEVASRPGRHHGILNRHPVALDLVHDKLRRRYVVGALLPL